MDDFMRVFLLKLCLQSTRSMNFAKFRPLFKVMTFFGGKAFICRDCTYWAGILMVRSKVCPNFVRVDAPQMCQSALGRQEAQQVKELKTSSQVSQHT